MTDSGYKFLKLAQEVSPDALRFPCPLHRQAFSKQSPVRKLSLAGCQGTVNPLQHQLHNSDRSRPAKIHADSQANSFPAEIRLR